MADNREKINRPGADENWYGDAILAQQGKHTLGCPGADVATQSAAIPTKIQQLFDDAGSMGGLLQTATLRGQIARFLHKMRMITRMSPSDMVAPFLFNDARGQDGEHRGQCGIDAIFTPVRVCEP
jgi:hypothetical protein